MTLEVVNEFSDKHEFVVKEHQSMNRVHSLITDELKPFFSLVNTFNAWQGPVISTDILGKSLNPPNLRAHWSFFVNFYCPCWGGYASPI